MTTSMKEYPNRQEAVVYMRTARFDPFDKDHGLRNQEQRCRAYAAEREYAVARVFTDAGVSGSSVDRPGLGAMLAYLAMVRDREVIVVMDDIARLARDIGVMLDLSAKIRGTGARLEFCEDATGAAIAQLPRTFQSIGRVRP